MSMQTFFTSDTHFGHTNILKFIDSKGNKVRDFPTVEDMDEYIVKQWNSVVRPYDRVYHLGDVAWKKDAWLRVRDRLNGTKRLNIGNHDDRFIRDYVNDFQRVHLWRIFAEHGFTTSHVPLRLQNLRAKTFVNVHGHMHTETLDDPHYMNVCVEQNDYTPFHLDQVKQYVEKVRTEHGHPAGA